MKGASHFLRLCDTENLDTGGRGLPSPVNGEGLRVKGGDAKENEIMIAGRTNSVASTTVFKILLLSVPTPRPGPLPVEGEGGPTPILVFIEIK